MSKKPLPHHELLDQVQLSVIPVVHELPMIQSLLKWVKHIIDGKSQAHPMGWMLLSEDSWSQDAQVEKLSRLSHSVSELGRSLRPLFLGTGEFSKNHQKIEQAIIGLNSAYREIPLIDPDIQLLKMGHTLFENPDLLTHLYNHSQRTSNMLTKASHLKQTIFDEIISSLSFDSDTKERLV